MKASRSTTSSSPESGDSSPRPARLGLAESRLPGTSLRTDASTTTPDFPAPEMDEKH
jgi:hypothetical protein